jgi:L,D-transpeptidase ErfK/SrfK
MKKSIFQLTFMFFLLTSGSAIAGSYAYRLLPVENPVQSIVSVVGFIQYHTIRNNETLLDIARSYGLGFNEIELLHPEIDPWIPKAGETISIPTQWVLPPTKYEEIVINIPEMRLYRFSKEFEMVKTYPIGIGREGFETPPGIYRVASRKEHPAWTVPPSAWEKYGRIVVPPGPDNPLGDFWLGLSADNIGIHGTNRPWGVGRLVSRGCIRLYPEHIAQLYIEVAAGAKVEIIYEPIKIGINGSVIYMEVHPDIYNKIPDMTEHAKNLIRQKKLWESVEHEKVRQCLMAKKGIPIPIGSISKGGDV